MPNAVPVKVKLSDGKEYNFSRVAASLGAAELVAKINSGGIELSDMAQVSRLVRQSLSPNYTKSEIDDIVFLIDAGNSEVILAISGAMFRGSGDSAGQEGPTGETDSSPGVGVPPMQD